MAFTTEDYCRRSGGEGWGSGGLPPETFFRATPSRKRLVEHGMKATSQMISVPIAKTDPLT